MMKDKYVMGHMLRAVWDQQATYNEQVKARQTRTSADWMQTYILGLISEAGQLLEAMKWKQHKLESKRQFGDNVAEELADITKYVFSMWQLMGISSEEMLTEMYRKGEFLNQLYRQDFDLKLGDKVVIFDLDDVLADLRTTLFEHLKDKFNDGNNARNYLSGGDMHFDSATGIAYDRYRIAKHEWESAGGYRSLPALYDLGYLTQKLQSDGFSIVIYTARPVSLFKRIRHDTFYWLAENKVAYDELLFGREERVGYACQLKNQGAKVVLVDDNPETAERAVRSGIPVVCPTKPYNGHTGDFDGSVYDLVDRINQEAI